MTYQDPYLKEVFKEPPLTAFKRQKNIRDHILRAKLPNSQRAYPLRNLKGMKKCKKYALLYWKQNVFIPLFLLLR